MEQKFQKIFHQDINHHWDTKNAVTVVIMLLEQNIVKNGTLKLKQLIGVLNGNQKNKNMENIINDR